jgi:hypothetical protein
MNGPLERQIWTKMPGMLSRVLEGTALLYIWGFFVFRARLNSLGVPPSPIPVLDQTYLIQGGSFVIVSLELLVEYAPLTLAFCVTGAALAIALHRGRAPGATATSRAQRSLRVLARPALTGATLLTLGYPIVVARSVVERCSHLLLPFQEAELRDCPQAGRYLVALMLAIGGSLLLAESVRTPRLWWGSRWLAPIGVALAVLDACLLPMAFGAALHHASYAVVTVETTAAAGAGRPAALVLATEKVVVIYTGGGLRLIPAEKVTAINVLCETTLARTPSCPGDQRREPSVPTDLR